MLPKCGWCPGNVERMLISWKRGSDVMWWMRCKQMDEIEFEPKVHALKNKHALCRYYVSCWIEGLLIYSLIFNIASCTLSEDSDDLYLERFPKLDTCEWSDRAIEVVHYRGIIAPLWFDEATGRVLHTIKGAYISYDNADPWVLYCSYTKSLHSQFHHEMQWKVGMWLLWDKALLRPRFYNG